MSAIITLCAVSILGLMLLINAIIKITNANKTIKEIRTYMTSADLLEEEILRYEAKLNRHNIVGSVLTHPIAVYAIFCNVMIMLVLVLV